MNASVEQCSGIMLRGNAGDYPPEQWHLAHACGRTVRDMLCTYNATLRCVRVTFVAVEKQCVLSIMRVFVYT